MLPMISTVDEVVTLRSWIDRIASQVEADGAAFDMPDVGVMVEVPAAALVADALMKHVDFVSIGSNDLTQYTLAADRTNGALGHLQDPLHPAVLALVRLHRQCCPNRWRSGFGVWARSCGFARCRSVFIHGDRQAFGQCFNGQFRQGDDQLT